MSELSEAQKSVMHEFLVGIPAKPETQHLDKLAAYLFALGKVDRNAQLACRAAFRESLRRGITRPKPADMSHAEYIYASHISEERIQAILMNLSNRIRSMCVRLCPYYAWLC